MNKKIYFIQNRLYFSTRKNVYYFSYDVNQRIYKLLAVRNDNHFPIICVSSVFVKIFFIDICIVCISV